jgi:serine/threonine protein kinase
VSDDEGLLAEACAIADDIDGGTRPAGCDACDARSNAARQLQVLANLIHAWRGQPPALREGPPCMWGPLQVLQKIGEGTFSEVFQAIDNRTGREVALKLLKPGPWPSEPIARAILEDSLALAGVRHANVIAVYGVAAHDGRMGIWMERLQGCTLEERLVARGPFVPRDAITVGIHVCRGVAAIHRAGLLHGDIKAQNVLQVDAGRLVLVDVGSGGRRGKSAVVRRPLAGTPLCLAPELFEWQPATERSDIYSIGVLLYHLVTGAYPVTGRTVAELRASHASGRRQRLADCRLRMPGGFVAAVERALAHDPSQRYAGVPALQAALTRLTGSRELHL